MKLIVAAVVAVVASCIGLIAGNFLTPKKMRFTCQDKTTGYPLLLMRTADKPLFISAAISCQESDVPAGGGL